MLQNLCILCPWQLPRYTKNYRSLRNTIKHRCYKNYVDSVSTYLDTPKTIDIFVTQLHLDVTKTM